MVPSTENKKIQRRCGSEPSEQGKTDPGRSSEWHAPETGILLLGRGEHGQREKAKIVKRVLWRQKSMGGL